ncbi:MAG: aminopeptidase [Verrucomicrobia bacterium]|nr:aminopeptidase [Verrucomicrobiota bacterium]
MTDKRIENVARVLVGYSLRIKKGDLFVISGIDEAAPLIREVYKQALLEGAHVTTLVGIAGLRELFFQYARDDQLKHLSPMALHRAKTMTAYLGLGNLHNTKSLSGVDPKKQALASQVGLPIMTILDKREKAGRFRWCTTIFPTQAHAQEASMSLADYEDFVYGACLAGKRDPVVEWKRISAEQARLVKKLGKFKTMRVVGKDTDLTVGVAGRKWVNCDGTMNFPDGEVFTGPVENSAEGRIRFSFPAIAGGREVEDIRLEFRKGKVVKATAAKGQEYLEKMIAIDPGATRIGEFAVGTNYGITRFTKAILFDEKIGGTCHLALGRGYAESGSKNRSAIHWDMICDLRTDSAIYADGKIIYKNGKFVM